MAAILAFAIPALAQPAPATAPRGTGMPPVTFMLDSMVDDHEQDIQENIFEYKLQAASDDPAEQVRLIQERNAELQNQSASKKRTLAALMAKNNSASDDKLVKLMDEVGASIEKLNNSSKKLRDHAAELIMLNGDAYKESLQTLIDGIGEAREATPAAKENNNDNNGNGGNYGNNGNGENNGNNGKNGKNDKVK